MAYRSLSLTHLFIAPRPALSLALLLWGILFFGHPGYAQEREFVIPAQSLDKALIEFATQAGVSVNADPDLLTGKHSMGVTGRQTNDAALEQLLKGSGLQASPVGANTFTILPAPTPQSQTPVPPNGPAAQAGDIQKPIKVSEVVVKDVKEKDIAVIGNLPPEYAGGQVAQGGRAGFLGNRKIMELPFAQNNYTSQLIRDQQARTITEIMANDPSVHFSAPRFSETESFLIRGFVTYANDWAFDGQYGLPDKRRPAIEGLERIEVLRGPSAFLNGLPVPGNIGGFINMIPKRAYDEPLTRFTTRFTSNSLFGGHLDVGRRFGQDKQFGARINAAYDNGETPIKGNRQEFGVFTGGFDYRANRFRIAADVSFQHDYILRPPAVITVSPGVQIPSAPDTTRSFQQPWETYDSQTHFGLLRGEYDLNASTTAWTAYGHTSQDRTWLTSFLNVLNSQGDASQDAFLLRQVQRGHTAEAGIRTKLATGPFEHSLAFVGTGFWSTFSSSFAGAFVGSPITTNLFSPTFVGEVTKNSLEVAKNSTQNFTSLAASDTISMLEKRVQLTVGARLQRVDTKNFVQPTGQTVSEYDRAAATPAVGLIVRPLQWLALYTNYVEGLTGGPTAPPTAANAGQVFAPVVSNQVEVGTKVDVGRFGASFALFQITQASAFIDPLTRIFEVTGRQRNRGAEVMMYGTPVEGIRLLGGITFLDGVLTETAGGALTGKLAPGVPSLRFNLYGEADVPWISGLTLTQRTIYTSPQYFDQANTQTIPGWWRFDVGTRYAFRLWERTLFARFNIENLMASNYWASTGDGAISIGSPRTYLASLQIDF